MIKSNMLGRIACSAVVVLATAVLSFVGCTTSDDTLGSGFLPENQEMFTGTTRLAKGRNFLETRLYQTDSLRGSNLGYGYFGSIHNDTTGRSDAGFMSQFLYVYRVDSGYFGYRPIFDSAQILLKISTYGRDTLTPQTFNVYEIISNEYIDSKSNDSLFHLNFDPKKYVSSEPLFSFTFPNGTSTGPSTKAVTLTPTARGRDFVNRLMISDGTKPYQEGVGYSIYQDDKAFVKVFKGLYIRPANPEFTLINKGSVYGTDLTASGFTIYGRNRVQADPTLIKDTIGAEFIFSSTKFNNSNLSINMVSHNFDGSHITPNDVSESNLSRPTSKQIIVSGLGGVVSELTFTQELFDALEEVISKANTDMGTSFRTLAMNRALMTIYFTGSNYDWTKIDQAAVSAQMSVALDRLGSYTNYKKLSPILDYDYYGEKTYGYTLSYGGYINRSQGCYVLDISSYLQALWNAYIKAKRASADGKVDLSLLNDRSIYLGPGAYSIFTNFFAQVQGMDDNTNNAPVKIDLTYTLIK